MKLIVQRRKKIFPSNATREGGEIYIPRVNVRVVNGEPVYEAMPQRIAVLREDGTTARTLA